MSLASLPAPTNGQEKNSVLKEYQRQLLLLDSQHKAKLQSTPYSEAAAAVRLLYDKARADVNAVADSAIEELLETGENALKGYNREND